MNKIATLTLALVLSAASAAHALGTNRGGSQKSLTAGSTRRWGARFLAPLTQMRSLNAAHEPKMPQPADKPLETNQQTPEPTGQIQFGLQELRKNHPALDASLNGIERINSGAGTQSADQQAAFQSQVYDQSAPKNYAEVYAAMERDYLADPKHFEAKLRKTMLGRVNKDIHNFLESAAQEGDKGAEILTRQHDRYKDGAAAFGLVALLTGFNTLLGSISNDLTGIYPEIFVISTVGLIATAIISSMSGRGAETVAKIADTIRKVAAKL